MAKTPKQRIERPITIIKSIISPVSMDVKTKISNAFQSFVTAVKDKHLS